MVGRGVSDFSAYYNKFYNAQKTFDQATDHLDALDQPVDRSAFLPVFVDPAQVQSADALEKTIEKGADLLRKHPRSKWVDDALLLIGKSYFYQQNYVGAEQKFREVAEQDGPLTGEARFWMGRALLSAGKHAAAEKHLRHHLAPDSLSGRWAAQMRLLQGDLRVRRGQWEAAARALAEGLRGVQDGRLRARALFLRGQALEAAGRWGDAARSYRSAVEERPRYELAYAAETSALRTAARAGRNEAEILRRLERMERDDKNEAKLPALALLRGQVYQAMGRAGRARRTYQALLYPGEEPAGTPSPSAAVRGRAHYALATLYRDVYDNFSRAAAHFDTAATALPNGSASSGETGPSTPPTAYAVTDSRRQAERYGRVAEASAEVARLDSLLRLGDMDEGAFEAFVDSVRQARAQKAREAQEQQARRRAEQGFRRRSAPDREGRGASAGGSASLAGRGGDPGKEAGFLFHRDPAQVQEGRRVFRRRWGDRPRVPGWRRRAAISTQAEQAARGDSSGPVGPDADVAAGGRSRVDVSAVPRSPERLRRMRAERAAARYDLGNALLLATERPDSAAFWFRRVIEESPETEAARRARYALAEAERAAGRPEAARRQYRRVVRKQPGTRRARRARRRLEVQEAEAPAASEEAAPEEAGRAEQGYTRAYRAWQRGAREDALQKMLDLAAAHPRASIAPRALMASARIFAEWAHRSGRSLRATPLPARVPDSLRALLLDSTAAAPDSGALVSDSASAPPGSGATASDSASAALDATAAGAPPPLTLSRLLEGLARRYPETAHADRARRMRAALRAPDSAPDSAAATRETKSWGIVVASTPERAQADSVAAGFRARRRATSVRVLAVRPRGERRYCVVVGAFPTRAEAQAALRRRRASLPADSRLLAVPASGAKAKRR